MADHRFPGAHFYQGMLLLKEIKEGSVIKVRDMSYVEGDILIASYPKTGTTWMQELTWAVNNEGDLAEALKTPLHQRMLFLEYSDEASDFKAGIDMLQDKPRPAIMKTHLPANILEKAIRDSRVKIIVTFRNPKDTLVSYYHFYRAVGAFCNFSGSWDDFFELYKTNHLSYGDFFDWYASWLPYLKYPNVQLYAYEDMKADLKTSIARLSSFLAKSLNEDKIDTIAKHTVFESMKTNKMTNYETIPKELLSKEISPFMRKGAVGDWKNYFTDEQSHYIDDECKRKLGDLGSLLKFDL